MTKWPKDNQAARNAFYGDPAKGQIGPQMVRVVPPFAMYYEGKRIKAIQFHRKAAAALLAALNEIWDYCEHDQAKIDAAGVSRYTGAYNHRKVRGSKTKWSNHAYAAAIDLNAGENALGVKKGTMPQFVVDAFCRQGAMWGGWYRRRPDWMHFEFVDNGGRQPQSPPPSAWREPVALFDNVEPDAPADEFEDSPVVAQPAPANSINIQAVQRNLLELGYHEVSAADGLWGSKTAAGIAAYKNDKGLPGAPVIDAALIASLNESVAKGECRLIPSDRANVTAKDIAPAIPAVKQTLLQRLWAKIVGIGAMIAAAFQGLSDQFHSAREYVQPFTSWFRDVPGWLWLVGIGGVALLIYLSANKATESLVDAKRTSRLN